MIHVKINKQIYLFKKEGGVSLIEPSEFGIFLKEKRNAVNLKQEDLAVVINKSGQYISNIEKGKNNAPPKAEDLEKLIKKLGLNAEDSRLFKEKAAADRFRLPDKQMEYVLRHYKLIELINYGVLNDIDDKQWEEVLNAFLGGNKNETK